MKNIFRSYSMALEYLLKDRVNFILAMIPVFIGVVIYLALGGFIFKGLIPIGEEWVSSYFSNDVLGDVFYYLIVGLVSVFLYLLVSWTMVLIISLIASPFNDLISSRIEKIILNKKAPNLNEGFSQMLVKIFKTLFNEIKKVLMILFFTLIAFVLNLLPVLVPLAFMITAVLFAVQFVDYSWSRHDMPSRQCYRETRKNWIPYALSGSGFLIASTIPVVNLLVPAYATSYYTVLWTLNNKKKLLEPISGRRNPRLLDEG